jgi:hypothetical protein
MSQNFKAFFVACADGYRLYLAVHEFGCIRIHGYPVSDDGAIKIDSYHLTLDDLECDMQHAVLYLKELFCKICEVTEWENFDGNISKIEALFT